MTTLPIENVYTCVPNADSELSLLFVNDSRLGIAMSFKSNSVLFKKKKMGGAGLVSQKIEWGGLGHTYYKIRV